MIIKIDNNDLWRCGCKTNPIRRYGDNIEDGLSHWDKVPRWCLRLATYSVNEVPMCTQHAAYAALELLTAKSSGKAS